MGRGEARRFKRKEWQPIRWPIELPVILREQGVCPLPVTLVDVSLTGCRLSTGYRTRAGAWAKLSLPGFLPFSAVIVWSDLSYAALRFDHPLHLAVMQHILSLGTASASGSGLR